MIGLLLLTRVLLLLSKVHDAIESLSMTRLKLKHFLKGDVCLIWLVTFFVQNAQVEPNFIKVGLQS